MADSIVSLLMLGIPAVCLAITFVSLPWLLRGEREKRRSSPQAGAIGVADDLFHPEAYQAARIWETQLELPSPAAIPGDKALHTGKITIDLN